MKTGPSNKATRELIVDLDKQGKKSGKAVWKVLSAKLAASSRRRIAVNIYTLRKAAKANKDKVLVVPGKVLSKGELQEKIEVACFACSGKAKKKIEGAKGKVITLKDLMKSNMDASKMVIVQ